MERSHHHCFSKPSLLLTLALCVGVGSPLFAGVYYEAVTSVDGGKGGSTVHAWLEGENAHIEFVDSDVPHVGKGNYLITNDAGQTFYMVNPKEETYMVWDMAAVMGLLEGMSSIVSFDLVDPTVKKLEEKSGESMLGYDTRYVRYASAYEMKLQIMGMKRSNRVETEQEMWLTDDIDVDAMRAWIKGFRSTGSKDMDELMDQEMAKVDGFPLKTVTVTVTTDKKGRQNRSRSLTEVRTVREESPPAAKFQIPSGYQRVEMLPESEEGGNPLKGLFGGG